MRKKHDSTNGAPKAKPTYASYAVIGCKVGSLVRTVITIQPTVGRLRKWWQMTKDMVMDNYAEVKFLKGRFLTLEKVEHVEERPAVGSDITDATF